MKVGTKLTLLAKSRKGKNKIHEGLGDTVIVLQQSHPANAPAVLVAPAGEPTMASKFIRWIRLGGEDPDFDLKAA